MKVTLLHTYFTIKALHIEVVAFANRIQSSGAKTPTICHCSNNLHGICTQSTCWTDIKTSVVTTRNCLPPRRKLVHKKAVCVNSDLDDRLRVCACVWVNCVCLWHTGANSVTQGFCSIMPCNDTQSHFVQGDTSIFWIYCREQSLSWRVRGENSGWRECVFACMLVCGCAGECVLGMYLCVCVLSSGKQGNGIICSDQWSWKLPIHWFDKQQERPPWY